MTLVYLVVAWLAGIALAQAVHFPWQVLPPLGLAACLGLLLYRDQRHVRLLAGCGLMLALGAGRFLLALPHFDENSLSTYNDVGWVTLEGVVVGEPDERATYTNLRLRAERLTLPDGATLDVEGLVLVKANRYPERRYGDRVLVEGALETPPILEDFSYQDYLARQDIYSLVPRARVTLLTENQANPIMYYLLAFKRQAQSTIARILPEPQAALLTGILLGVETGIPNDLMDDFSATGTTHIIAISGFNITIISGIFAGLARKGFGQRRAVWVAIAGVALYTLFVGASAAVMRASLMGILYLLSQHLGRATYAPASIAAAAFGMTLHNPHVLWDVGFQLSFAATVGLVLYTEPLERGLERILKRFISAQGAKQIVGWVNEALIVTLAAQITTTPIILGYFGRLSLVTLVTNLLILPVQSWLMIWGGVATLLGLILLPLGKVVGWVAWAFLTYTIEIVRLTARPSFASLPLPMDAGLVWAYYVLLGALTWWFTQSRERRESLWAVLSTRLEAKVLVVSAAVLLMLALFAWRTLPDGRLHVVFLDVGQGDAIFIQTPTGRQVLVDGGPVEATLLSQLGRQMPFWDRSLDLVVLTHPDSDHINGLVPVLERYRVDGVIFRHLPLEAEVYVHWLRLLEMEQITVYQGEAGLEIIFGDGPVMTVLHPGVTLFGGANVDVNNNSVVTRLVYGDVSVLLTGDIEAVVEQQLVAGGAPLESTVLKAGHHGSCSSTTPEFLGAVNPEIVVISVGAENRFGHPCAGVLERLADLPVYRTDQHGVIEVVSDGARVWVETGR
ncbi:MAG TPA: DNA internalization-related competence protein ComEC/Rec2 [Chloroflexi bacterium]|nr:DNA internalization-related competence protein ComEC/Rec2 [Chloroflexota bacterium]